MQILGLFGIERTETGNGRIRGCKRGVKACAEENKL